MMFVGGGPRAGVTQVCLLDLFAYDTDTPSAQLHFNPTMPHILYAAYRRHEAIYSWDLRASVDAPICVYRGTNPKRGSNQKVRFDIDLSGRWMSTGDQACFFLRGHSSTLIRVLLQRGSIQMFDLHNDVTISTGEASPPKDPCDVYPTLEFGAHNGGYTCQKSSLPSYSRFALPVQDAIGSVAFHPLRSTLISASGSRHFHPEHNDVETSSESDESGEDDEAGRARKTGMNVRKRINRPHPVTLDSSIKLWNFEPGNQIQSES